MSNFKIRNLKKGTVIFSQGDHSEYMYDIVFGRVGIYLNYKEPSEKLLTELEQGQFFGEMGMIERMPRSATAVALDRQTTVAEISQKGFVEYFKEYPNKVLQIMQNMSKRLRELSKDYLEACKYVAAAGMNEQKIDDKILYYSDRYDGYIKPHIDDLGGNNHD